MRILVISLPGIGNSLLTTPMIELLRQENPHADITALVMFKGSKEVLERNPNLDSVIVWEFFRNGVTRSMRFLLALRRKKFDISILTYPSNRIEYNLISLIIGARTRIAHRYDHFFWRNLAFLSTRLINEDGEKHDVEENVMLLSLIGVTPKSWNKPKVYVTENDTEFACKWLRQRNMENEFLIGMHPGTATFKNQERRRWERKKYGELGKRLVQTCGAHILIFGGSDEEELKTNIQERIGEMAESVSNTTMRETAALVTRCSLFISVDSALMHIAASLNVPCVAVFGPTNPRWVHPYRTRHMIVQKGFPCSPCFYYSQKPLSCVFGDFRCVKSITVEEVLNAALKLLG